MRLCMVSLLLLSDNYGNDIGCYDTCSLLETNEDELIRHVIAIGLYYIEQHHHHKDAAYKPLRKKDIAEKFGITQHKFSEISQGISYAGGEKK